METFKDFFEELKSRLSNPFLSSFIIAWLICNWQIPLALIFYTQDELKTDGYSSYINVVQSHLRWFSTLALPFIVTVIYTFGFPYLKAFIKEFQAKIISKSEDRILTITKEGTMPVEKYIKLREAYNKQIGELKNLIESESAVKEENNRLLLTLSEKDNEIKKLSDDNTTITKERDRYTSANNPSNLNGDWLFSTQDGAVKQHWEIQERQISINDKVNYTIDYYFSDPTTKHITFIYYDQRSNANKSIFFLRSDKRNRKLEGYLNGTIPVIFEREDIVM